ncbi:MAG TPA: extracellular solute-binding protein, partial [Gemmatimonadales bacterium]|nr:extracellular solute-binding protein [Gemmatimonadales bacterium]
MAPPISGLRSLVSLAVLAAIACSDGREPLTVYSPHDRAILAAVEQAFERDHPEIDMRWLDMGSQEILDRLRFENPNPVADVWFGGPTTIFHRGVAEGVLEPSSPDWGSAVDSGGIGPDGLYWPVYRTRAV